MMGALRVRPARDDDYGAYARLVPQLGSGDPTPTQARWSAEICSQTLIAERDGVVLGYLFAQALSGTGYVRNLVTDLSARRQGVGRALMRAIAERLRGLGFTRWCLNVKPDNAAAIALYAELGLSPVLQGASLRVSWDALAQLPPPTAVARLVTPDDDDPLTARWDLIPGQLGYARAQGWTLLCLDGGDGVACFNPQFPGAFPFRAKDLGGASAMTAAMRPYALPHHDHVRIMVEGDLPLREALLALGAEVSLETVHMRGEIP